MINLGPSRKNKIDLADYNYKRDIENRVLMSTFSTFDVEVLEEILHSSLRLTVPKLCDTLDADLEELEPSLEKLAKTGIFERDGDQLVVDKEMRKYYESQILKFDDEFEPNMDFLQGLLRKVPIHVLPVWYSIPRSAMNIFEALLDRYLGSPRKYQRYLLELNLEDATLNGIMERVFTAPDFKVRSRDLREEFGLSREEFEECLLHLEFNFICCLSYNQIGNQWKEVVTPFHEWREFLRFRRDKMPKKLDSTGVERLRTSEFAAVQDATALLQAMPISVSEGRHHYCYRLDDDELARLARLCDGMPPLTEANRERYATYFGHLIGKLCLVEMAEEADGVVHPTEYGKEWCEMPADERAMAIYRHPHNSLVSREVDQRLQTERNLREVERSLERVTQLGWILFDDFFQGVIVPIGNAEEVKLEKKGRKWQYTLPTYSDEERLFIKASIFERLFEAGLVSIGRYEGKDCFCVTSFGRGILERPHS
jgi:hypothetical protein